MYHNRVYTTFMPPFDSSVAFDFIEDARECARATLRTQEHCLAVDIVDNETGEVVEFVTRGS